MFLGRKIFKTSFVAEEVTHARRLFLKGVCACCAILATDLPSAFATPADMQAHLDTAKKAAGDDLVSYLRLGDLAAPTSGLPPVSPQALMALPTPEPGQVFDNLYFVGNSWVSCWAITTSEGIIVIDAMDNDEEAKTIIVAGLEKLGLDPATIKTVIVTHGHGDHYGGANYLKGLFGCSIVMGEPDWAMLDTGPELDVPGWGAPPARDISVTDGSVVTLGDTNIDILLTPGHTPGTITLVFDVKNGDETHRAMLWGGTAFNFARRDDRIERLQTYIDATERVRTLAEEQSIEVFVSNHDLYDGAVGKLAQLQKGGANPFVVGNDTTLRALTVMHECAKATMIAWKA